MDPLGPEWHATCRRSKDNVESLDRIQASFPLKPVSSDRCHSPHLSLCIDNRNEIIQFGIVEERFQEDVRHTHETIVLFHVEERIRPFLLLLLAVRICLKKTKASVQYAHGTDALYFVLCHLPFVVNISHVVQFRLELLDVPNLWRKIAPLHLHSWFAEVRRGLEEWLKAISLRRRRHWPVH